MRVTSRSVVASWGDADALIEVGTRMPLEGDNIAVRVRRGMTSVRIDDAAEVTGPIGEQATETRYPRGRRDADHGRRAVVGWHGCDLPTPRPAASRRRAPDRPVHRAGGDIDRETGGQIGA